MFRTPGNSPDTVTRLSKPYSSFLRIPSEGRDVLKLDLVGLGRTGEAGLAEDDLLVNRAGH